jgi:uncharacterized membrane protein YfcA
MQHLLWYQYALIGLVFVWSGFVRSGLGFGGAVLSLPFMLLIVDRPLVFLPIVSVHLLVFASLTVFQNNRRFRHSSVVGDPRGTVDWRYLRYALAVMIVPKLIGVFGLITLPPKIMSGIIFGIVSIYSISYILNRPFHSNSKLVDALLLMVGGYFSGTSLVGAPPIIAVFAQRVAREQLRDTLFMLWLILVVIKLSAFVYAGVDLQLVQHLWLLPCAAVGHVIGLNFHRRLLAAETPVFFRVLGSVLLTVSIVGLWQVLRS